MNRPYVGITGFMERDTVKVIAELFNEKFGNYSRLFMVGVLCSDKIMSKEGNRHKHTFPQEPGKIGDIFVGGEEFLNLVHYHADDLGNLGRNLLVARNYAGVFCNGFQLNNAFKPHKSDFYLLENALKRFRFLYPEDRVVLQLNRVAIDYAIRHGGILDFLNPLVEKGYVTDFLIDPSGGEGKKLDINRALMVLRLLQDLTVGLGVAGGLNSQNLLDIRPILEEFPEISIDVQSGVMDRGQGLNVDKALAWITTAESLLALR